MASHALNIVIELIEKEVSGAIEAGVRQLDAFRAGARLLIDDGATSVADQAAEVIQMFEEAGDGAIHVLVPIIRDEMQSFISRSFQEALQGFEEVDAAAEQAVPALWEIFPELGEAIAGGGAEEAAAAGLLLLVQDFPEISVNNVSEKAKILQGALVKYDKGMIRCAQLKAMADAWTPVVKKALKDAGNETKKEVRREEGRIAGEIASISPKKFNRGVSKIKHFKRNMRRYFKNQVAKNIAKAVSSDTYKSALKNACLAGSKEYLQTSALLTMVKSEQQKYVNVKE